MSQSPDWKTHAKNAADKARPFLARAWSEIRQTAAATWAQAVRLSGFGIGRWRTWDLGRKALTAREALGEALFRAGQGDPKLRQAIADLDDRLRSIEAAKGSTRALKTERRGLCIRLAEGPLGAASAPAGVEAEFQSAMAANRALEAEQADQAARRALLWPVDAPTRTRTLIGAASVVLLLAVFVWWLRPDDETIPRPRPVVQKPAEPDKPDEEEEESPLPQPEPTPPPDSGETPPTPPPTDEPAPEVRAADLFADPPRSEAGKLVLDALGIGDLDGARAALEQMRNAGETDERYAILEAALPLLENEIVDPFTLIAYTFNFDENIAAFIPNGNADPVDLTVAGLRAVGNRSPSLRPFIADTVRCAVAGVLNQYVNGGGNVGLSDDILFSTRSHSETGGKGTSILSNAHLISSRQAEERYHGQRMWFVTREVPKANIGYHITGIWQKAIAFADELDSAGRERWQSIYLGLANRFAADGRFQSAVLMLVRTTSYNQFEFLSPRAAALDRSDRRKLTNLAIAFGYIMENWGIGGTPVPSKEEMKGSALAELGQWLVQFGDPKEVDIALACAGLERARFE